MNQLAVWMVALPMLAAPIAAMVTHRLTAWSISFAALGAMFVLSLTVAFSFDGALSTTFGNWRPPFGIEYRVDALNIPLLVLITGIALLSFVYALPQHLSEITSQKQPICYALFLLSVTGLLGMVLTHDLFNLYVFLEISSLATYALIAMGRSKQASVAAIEYLILGSIGATVYLVGIGFLYMATGTLNISDMAHILNGQLDHILVITGLTLVTLGFALKAAIAPLHHWMVQSYVNAPSFFAAFLSGTATKVALYVLIRVLLSLAGYEALCSYGLMALAAVAIFIGSIGALKATELKAMLAYSSVAQIGYMALALGLGTAVGIAAALLHLLMHGPAKAGLFLCVNAIEKQVGSTQINQLHGLGRRMKITCTAFAICGFSLVGIPLTAGFLSKWMLLTAQLNAGAWAGFGLLLLSGLFTVSYIGKILLIFYYETADSTTKRIKETHWILLLPLIALSLFCLYFGIFTDGIMSFIEPASISFFGVAQ